MITVSAGKRIMLKMLEWITKLECNYRNYKVCLLGFGRLDTAHDVALE